MVKKIKWKDFEIADLQPNLIPNGWDSFEPYGSGENYVENWDFSSSFIYFRSDGLFQSIKNNVLHLESEKTKDSPAVFKQNIGVQGEFIFRLKIKGNCNVRFGSQENPTNLSKIYELTDEWSFLEHKVDLNENSQVGMYLFDRNGEAQIDWIQITPIDNQHLVVEKTPLENGLTRIQTWGGNRAVKLFNWSKDTDEYITKSVNLENIGDNSVGIDPNTYGELVIVRGGEKKHVVITGKRQNPAARNQFKIRALNVSHSLDFIASNPQIVEGDKHNPVLVVDQLDDGTEHVRVYGAYPDTKLVYKGGGAIIGEPYVIESEIENLGGQLQMETTLDSTGQVIDKGINQINIKGTTDSKDFEIGVKLRDGTI